MDKALTAAYRASGYRVRLPRGGWATIRIDQPLPEPLQQLVGSHAWGFITAWNPRSQPRARQVNRMAQRQLLTALRALPATGAIRPGIGVGNGWREPSLFAIGPGVETLDRLARFHEQHAYVHGRARETARLRWP